MHTDDVLGREFLPVRAKILEVAVSLDRVQRADPTAENDPRMTLLRRGLETLLRPDDDRAEQIQLIFSRPYDVRWRQEFDMR